MDEAEALYAGAKEQKSLIGRIKAGVQERRKSPEQLKNEITEELVSLRAQLVGSPYYDKDTSLSFDLEVPTLGGKKGKEGSAGGSIQVSAGFARGKVDSDIEAQIAGLPYEFSTLRGDYWKGKNIDLTFSLSGGKLRITEIIDGEGFELGGKWGDKEHTKEHTRVLRLVRGLLRDINAQVESQRLKYEDTEAYGSAKNVENFLNLLAAREDSGNFAPLREEAERLRSQGVGRFLRTHPLYREGEDIVVQTAVYQGSVEHTRPLTHDGPGAVIDLKEIGDPGNALVQLQERGTVSPSTLGFGDDVRYNLAVVSCDGQPLGALLEVYPAGQTWTPTQIFIHRHSWNGEIISMSVNGRRVLGTLKGEQCLEYVSKWLGAINTSPRNPDVTELFPSYIEPTEDGRYKITDAGIRGLQELITDRQVDDPVTIYLKEILDAAMRHRKPGPVGDDGELVPKGRTNQQRPITLEQLLGGQDDSSSSQRKK